MTPEAIAAALELARVTESITDGGRCWPSRDHAALLLQRAAAYRAAIAPKRTRAEVDAEIAAEVRRMPLPSPIANCSEVVIRGIVVERLRDLCHEETMP